MRSFVVLLLILASAGGNLTAQEVDVKKLTAGFYAGINYSGISLQDVPDQFSVTEGTGISLGVLTEMRLGRSFSIAPAAGVALYGGKVRFPSFPDYDVMSAGAEFMLHGIARIGKGKLKPIIMAGPSLTVPINSPDETDQFPTASNITADAGAGLEIAFKSFQFSPRLVYSYGLSVVNGHPALPDFNLNGLTLRLCFRG